MAAMKINVVAFALFVALGVSDGFLHAAGDGLSQSLLQLVMKNLVMSLEESQHDEERLYMDRPSPLLFNWRDCGGSRAIVRIKGLQMSPASLKAPGKVSIGFNITAAKDVSGPISLNMNAQVRKEGTWKDVCSGVPGVCKKDNVCPKGLDSAADADAEENGAAAWVEEEEEENGGYQGRPSQTADPCVRKGNFSSPAKSYDIPAIPVGRYRVRASFAKGADAVACVYLGFEVRP